MNQPPPAAGSPASVAPPPTVASPAAPGSKRPVSLWLLGITAAHTLNDLYGQALPPLLPALRAAFGFSYFQGGILAFTAGGISAGPPAGSRVRRRPARRAAPGAGARLYPLCHWDVGPEPGRQLYRVAPRRGSAGAGLHDISPAGYDAHRPTSSRRPVGGRPASTALVTALGLRWPRSSSQRWPSDSAGSRPA